MLASCGAIFAFTGRFLNTTTSAGYSRPPKAATVAIVALACLLQSGCVVGRRTVPLIVPEIDSAAPAVAVNSDKGPFYVGAITDNREFEVKPEDPATPSIDGDLSAMSADQKATMIGRQRNTYGHAMGDVALPAEDSVTKITKTLVEKALQRRGYQISADAAAPNSASVSVDKFWGWSTPGFASISFEARVNCTIQITRHDLSSKLLVSGYGINHAQIASDANWQKAYQLAFEDFLSKLDAELTKAGL